MNHTRTVLSCEITSKVCSKTRLGTTTKNWFAVHLLWEKEKTRTEITIH